MPPSRQLVSVVVPSFNQGRYLEESLRSVLEQTYSPIECIVTDGGSKDDSVAIIKKYEHRLKYWHSRKDKGHADALVQGFAQSTGSILAWVNSDDLLAPDAVEKAVAALEKRPQAVMVYGNRACIDERSRLLYYRPSMPFLARTPYISFTLAQESCFMRREAYFKVGGLRTDLWFSFDYELFSRLALLGDVFFDSRIWGFFRKHSASKTMTAYQSVGLKDEMVVQEKLWGGRVNRTKWAVVRTLFRLYSLCSTLWVPRPVWPACLPPVSKRSLPRRIYDSLHEDSVAKRVLRRVFIRSEGPQINAAVPGPELNVLSPPELRKPRLIVVELWGLGDLIIATPFLQAASKAFSVTLLAKPYAEDLRARFWPDVRVVPFLAPWTAFRRKYRLLSWPWKEMNRLRHLRQEAFAVGLSARWDPRDHFVLVALGARKRVGFSRLGSRLFLTQPLPRPNPAAHRYESWRALGQALGLDLPLREKIPVPSAPAFGDVLVHTGAGQPVRVWPLDEYRRLVAQMRQAGYRVRVVCDADQRDWWQAAGETEVATPSTVTELLALMDGAAAFIGNDSGPGHIAAACGIRTFTIFGPQLPLMFAPLHPAAQWLAGKPCPYKPCSDYCRFPVPHCLCDLSEAEVWLRVSQFLAQAPERLIVTDPAERRNP